MTQGWGCAYNTEKEAEFKTVTLLRLQLQQVKIMTM